jgi:hypothetical protein
MIRMSDIVVIISLIPRLAGEELVETERSVLAPAYQNIKMNGNVLF